MRLRLSVLVIAALMGCGLPVRAEDASKAPKAPEHKKELPKSHIEMEPILTTIVTDNQAAGMLLVAASLDVPNEALRAEVTRSLPVLRDAYIRNLMSFATMVRVDSPVDQQQIAERLQRVTDRALKKKGAKLLLTHVEMRAKPH